MPRYLKTDAISLVEAAINSYTLALYGLAIPQAKEKSNRESRYAPVIGLLGASIELLVKACLVQAKGPSVLFTNDDINAGIYKFGSDALEEFRVGIRDNETGFHFLWRSPESITKQQGDLLNLLSKFKLLQRLRANGLHAGKGCSKDVTLATANDVYDFIKLLALSKKLGAYLKAIPAPDTTVIDREAIIEDLTRRCNAANSLSEKVDCLSAMYLVLPFVPETQPEWLTDFGKAKIAPPQEGDINYLVRTLNTAHSIYLMKARGGREGVPVRIDNSNPDALPISVQYLKRELKTIPDKFYNDNLAANTRLEQENRLDLPIEDFIVDLYALGIEKSNIIRPEEMLTAQQTWAYVSSANQTSGNPRPYWFFIRRCNELDRLKAMLQKASSFGNAYLKKRMPLILTCIQAIKDGGTIKSEDYPKRSDPVAHAILNGIKEYYNNSLKAEDSLKSNLTPSFIRKNPLSAQISDLIADYLAGNITIGVSLENILKQEELTENDKKVARMLLPACYKNEDRNGLVAVLRTSHLKGYQSGVRKMMFYTDFIKNGPLIDGIDSTKY